MSDVSNTPSDEGGEGPCLAHLLDESDFGVDKLADDCGPPSLGADEVRGGAVGDPLHG